MLGFPTLDVAIGIAFFYLLFSLICTTANEVIARWFKKRPQTLEDAIRQLLGGVDFKNAVLNHPLICSLSHTTTTNGKEITEIPSYIPASTFATALLDRLTGPNSITDLKAITATLTPIAGAPRLTLSDGSQVQIPRTTQVALQALLEKASGDWNSLHAEIEGWYNATMDRAEGWYKRYIQKQTYLLAALIVLWADFDTLQVGRRMWLDSALRTVVVEQARHRVQQGGKGTNSPFTGREETLVANLTGWNRDIQELESQTAALPDASGTTPQHWYSDHRPWKIYLSWFVMHVFGWLLSVLAISLGAPFWFDVLNRFMNLRNTGRAPDEPRAKNAPIVNDTAGAS